MSVKEARDGTKSLGINSEAEIEHRRGDGRRGAIRERVRSADEVISRYRSGERYFGYLELEEPVCDFRGIELSGADFSGSFLVANFRDANLRSVNFTRCNIKTCDFRGADLQNAVFREAALESTEFEGAILIGADFEGASIFSQRLGAGELPDW